MNGQQTLLRVITNQLTDQEPSTDVTLDVTYNSMSYTGTGIESDPFIYSGNTTYDGGAIEIQPDSDGTFFISYSSTQDVNPRFNNDDYMEIDYFKGGGSAVTSNQKYYGKEITNIQYTVKRNDKIRITFEMNSTTGVTMSGSCYFVGDIVSKYEPIPEFEVLDTDSGVPIKINKSFAELQNIAKKNSDYSVPLTLPGSKRNNRFFETYYNVDMSLLNFDVTKKVPCEVLVEGERYFDGYLKLNKINVKNSAVEYDVTLYSTISNIFGDIGNNLLKDLDFNDAEYHFNHQFHWKNMIANWRMGTFEYDYQTMRSYDYPILHNGYNYSGNDVIFSGATAGDQSRLFTSTVVGSYPTFGDFTADGGLPYRINSPYGGIYDNQIKPSLSVYNLIKLMFKEYGYTINSKFFETPWFKSLQTYGYYGSDASKFSYIYSKQDCVAPDGVSVMIRPTSRKQGELILVKKGTKMPITCCETVKFTLQSWWHGNPFAIWDYDTFEIPAGDFKITYDVGNGRQPFRIIDTNASGGYIGVPFYNPNNENENQIVPYGDDDLVNFNLVIDPKIKQIDFLSSLAKKFNLVFVPDPETKNQIIIEPYDYYINTGDVHDWTEKLSYDEGFTVEPAFTKIDSTVLLTDKEDNDEGNKNFKDKFNKVYGEKQLDNPTDFKPKEKKIETLFGPQVVRTWDTQYGSGNIGLPLGIAYVGSTEEGEDGNTFYAYKSIKTNPKLFFNLGNFPPFVDQVAEYYDLANFNTQVIRITPADGVSQFGAGNTMWGSTNIPMISTTSTVGNPDSNKLINDNLSILFDSELPVDLGVETYDTYTENDTYSLFYQNRIQNIFNKNTRFVTGKFLLNLNDLKNLRPNDLIKINEQYFNWNKISGYNLTDTELTPVELVQTNRVYRTYPDRYFIYQYADGGQYEYKWKTYFDWTQAGEEGGDRQGLSSLTFSPTVRSNYYWAIFYDYMVGVLGGNVSSITFCVPKTDFIPWGVADTIVTMREVTKAEYESSTALSWRYDGDTEMLWGYSITEPRWEQTDFPYPFYLYDYPSVAANVASGVTQMNTILTTVGITKNIPNNGPLVTPTPTATPSPTPTPDPASRFDGNGSMILSYGGFEDSAYCLICAGDEATPCDINDHGYIRWQDTDNLYTTYLKDQDHVSIYIRGIDPTLVTTTPSVYRRDYTNDDQGGDMGIVDVGITGVTTTTIFDGYLIEFQVEENPDAYNFEYRIDLQKEDVIPASGTCCTYQVLTEGIVYPLDAAGPEFSYVDYVTGEVMFGDTVVTSEGKCFLYGDCNNDYWNHPYWGPLFITKTRIPRGNGFCNFGEIVCQPEYSGNTINAVCGSVTQLKDSVPITIVDLGPCPTPTPTATAGTPTPTPTLSASPTPTPTATLCQPIRELRVELDYEATFATTYYSTQQMNINEIKATIYSECYPDPQGNPTTYSTGILSGFASPQYYDGTVSGSTQPITLTRVEGPDRQGMWAGEPQDINIEFLQFYTPQPGQTSLAISSRTYEVYVDDVLVQTEVLSSYSRNMSALRYSFTSQYIPSTFIYGTTDFTITGVTIPTTDSVIRLKVIDDLIPDLSYPSVSPLPTATPTPTVTGPTPTPNFPTPTPEL